MSIPAVPDTCGSGFPRESGSERSSQSSTVGLQTPIPCVPRGSFTAMGPFVIRAAVTGLALWVVTKVVHGLSFVGGDNRLQQVGIIFVVAVIFGLVNAFIKPIVQILSIPLYIL